ASPGRVKHSRAVYLVPKRHQGEVRERLTHPLAFLRLHDEHEEAAAASAAEFATFSTCLKGPRVMAVDLRGGNLGSDTPLQHPAAVKSLAHLLELDVLTGAEGTKLIGVVAHVPEDVQVSRRVAPLLGEPQGGRALIAGTG